jgi:hypothetical protein
VIILSACLGVLIVGYTLTPASRGVGTHTQLGLSACGFEGLTGLPCMTCGMTTATSLATHGRFIESFITQPAGLAFAGLMAIGTWVGGWAAFSGMPLAPLGHRLGNLWTVVLVGVVVGGAWVYKLAMMLAAAQH